MIRVLWVTHVYPRDETDLQGLFLHRLAKELPARGVEIHVLSPGAAGAVERGTLDGVSIRRFPYPGQESAALAYTGEMHRAAMRRPLAFLRFLRCMMRETPREIEALSPDLLHAHWWFPGGLACRRARAAMPYVLSLHGTDVRILTSSRLPWPLARWVVRGAARVLPVSETIGRRIRSLRLGAGEMDVLPMPADAEAFRPAPPDPDTISFVVPARLVAQKRIDVAIRALRWCRDQGVPARLDIVGEGEKRDELTALTRRLDLTEAVRFHGFIPQDSLTRLFQASRAVVLTSRDEGYGLVLIEAALCERPSVGVRSGAIEDFVEDGVTGHLVEPGDHAGLGAILCRIARDPAAAERLGRAARERALPRTSGPLADRLARIYEETAASYPRGSRGRRIP